MPKVLTEAQVKQFHELGYVGPFTVMPPEEMAGFRARVEQFERQHPDQVGKLYQGPHHLFTWLYDLVAHPRLAAAASDILGATVLCPATAFRIKEPGAGSYVDWHQDAYYVKYEPIWMTSLVCFTDQTLLHGCLHVIPGSHGWGVLRHEETADEKNMLTRRQRIVAPFDESLAVPVEARAGEVTFFHHKMVHGSPPNRSKERRINYLIDVVPANAKREGRRESAILLCGTDAFDNFDHEPRPGDDFGPLALKRHREVLENRNEKSYAGSKYVSPALM